MFILFLIYIYPLHITYSQQNYRIELRSYEHLGVSSNKGHIMINNTPYELPAVVYLEPGLYILRYIPEPEYNFSYWELSGVNLTSKPETETPNLISVYQPGEVRAYYKKYPELYIGRPSELKDMITTRSPIELRAKITYFSEPVADAEVSFYVNDLCIASGLTDVDGCISTLFEPKGDSLYTWYMTAEKIGYTSATSDEWKFTIADVTLKPFDGELVDRLPFTLNTQVSVDGAEIDDASVDFYLDGVFESSLFTQSNGVASCILDSVSTGPHEWFVIVWVPGYPNRFAIETRSFAYCPSLKVHLGPPGNGESINKPVSQIELSATVRSPDGVVPGANCSFYFDGRLIGHSIADKNGLASLKFSPPEEGREYIWRVIASKPYCQNYTSETWRFYYPIQPPYVEVDKVSLSGMRVDVGGVQVVGFHLRWENGSDVEGALVKISDTYEVVTNESGWAIREVTSDRVCEEKYWITNVAHEGMGELRNADTILAVIWDRVSIELQAENERVDVGTNATLIEVAKYEFDGSPFFGKIRYDGDLYSDEVIGKTIGVEAIEDEKHGLTVFDANEVSLIWDRVNLELQAANLRVQVGTEADILCRGVYEYDSKPFKGSVMFDKDLMRDDICEVRYEVREISDELYNLSSFTSNTASCIFDDIEVEQEVNTAIPTQIAVVTEARYVYDGKPVEGARVLVNGVGEHLGSGSYRSVVYSFLPLARLVTEVTLDGFDAHVIETRTYSLGNSCALSVVVLLTIYIVVRPIFKRKR